jgi:hypothetical protein
MLSTPQNANLTISDLLERKWGLQLRCVCGHVVRWYRGDLQTLPGGAALYALSGRLRCDVCCTKGDGVLSVIEDAAARAEGDVERFNASRKYEG